MTTTRNRTIARLALGLVLLASLTTAALAQENVQLNLQLSEGTRSVEVTDLAGDPLEDLTLAAGQPASYRVTVTDSDYLTDEGFTVLAENGNLYQVTAAGPPVAVDYDTLIASEDVTLAPGIASPVDVAVDLLPIFELVDVLVGDLAACTTALQGIGLSAEDVTEVAGVCTAFIAAAEDVGDPLEGIAIPGDLLDSLDLTGLLDDLLGLATGATGSFDNPSFRYGIGAADPAAALGEETMITVLSSTPPTELIGDLLAAVQAAIGFAGTEAVTDIVSPAAVLQALVNTGNATAGTLAAAVGELSTAGQTAVLNALFEIGLGDLDLGVLQNLTGSYSATPSLTVVPDPGTPAGSYAGTHTITIVSS